MSGINLARLGFGTTALVKHTFKPWRFSMWLSMKRGPVVNRYVFASLTAAALIGGGCSHKEKSNYKSVSQPPTVSLVRPTVRNIVRTVGQPSFIESYERTSIYPKLTGYIEKWIVDIGDKVKKGETLAKLFVPELVEDFGTKKATVQLDEQKIDLANKLVEVADANVKASKASVEEAKAILAKYSAEVERWSTEVGRLQKEVDRGVIDPQVLLESTNQLKSSTASMGAAKATIQKSEADLLSSQAQLGKTKVDVGVAKADLAVATSEAKRIEAWVGYITLTAPFDGIVVARNANTLDFVTPGSGDPSADSRSPDLSPSGRAAPIYVIDRTDIVRIFVDIPEQDANYVKIGTKASILTKAYRDEPIAGSVTRTSWALNVKSRTLRAEIDLVNPGGQLLPGMYSYAKVIIDRPSAKALPVDALAYTGEKTFCWIYEDGHSIRTEIRTGVSDGEWIEVTNLLRWTKSKSEEVWTAVDGSEQVILGDLTVLTDGGPVSIAPADDKSKGAATTKTAGLSAADGKSLKR